MALKRRNKPRRERLDKLTVTTKRNETNETKRCRRQLELDITMLDVLHIVSERKPGACARRPLHVFSNHRANCESDELDRTISRNAGAPRGLAIASKPSNTRHARAPSRRGMASRAAPGCKDVM
jgi:hypothetical protein